MKPKKKIAIIGSGISGLYLAWKISKKFNVTVYEKNNYFGGHSNTINVKLEKKIPVDTGFIVFNKKNYPNLVNLFKKLNISIEKSNMSFAIDLKNQDFYYSGTLKGLFAQKRNLIKKSYWIMLIEIINFYIKAPLELKKKSSLTLKEFLDKKNYSEFFKEKHIYPIASAIWSTKKNDINKMPVISFINFFNNHGLFKFFNRPQWYTVKGGSKNYVKKLIQNTPANFKKNIKVLKLKKEKNKILVLTNKNIIKFDHVVCACHANEASSLLKNIDPQISSLLKSFHYSKNKVYLHSDQRLMPRNKKIWSSWNYLSFKKKNKNYISFTYWMNKLQNIDNKYPFFLTLNSPIKPKKIFYQTTYTHPIFTKKSMEIPNQLNKIQGKNKIWFCGSYFSYGFHEDGVKSSIKISKLFDNEIT